jgi:hypothetical protein
MHTYTVAMLGMNTIAVVRDGVNIVPRILEHEERTGYDVPLEKLFIISGVEITDRGAFVGDYVVYWHTWRLRGGRDGEMIDPDSAKPPAEVMVWDWKAQRWGRIGTGRTAHGLKALIGRGRVMVRAQFLGASPIDAPDEYTVMAYIGCRQLGHGA